MSRIAPPHQNHKLSLQKLLLGFIKFVHDNGNTSFPPFKSHFWHELLFLLQSEYSNTFPALDCIGKFDWNGIHPKCREFDVARFAIRYQCYSKVADGRVFLDTEKRDDVSPLATPSLGRYHPELAKKTLEIARSIPGFFEE